MEYKCKRCNSGDTIKLYNHYLDDRNNDTSIISIRCSICGYEYQLRDPDLISINGRPIDINFMNELFPIIRKNKL